MKALESFIGLKYGKLTILKELERKVLPCGQKTRRVECICDCGTVKQVQFSHLRHGKTTSCGKCTEYERLDFVGKTFGLITIIKDLPDLIVNGRDIRMVEGVCACGVVKSYRLSNLRYQKSCGCLTSEILKKNATTHGLSKHPLHLTWGNMRNRCYNSKTDSYYLYGGKGIKVCKKWKENYKAFYDWSMANGWKPGLEIDRYPNKRGNYTPSNCRWATPLQQANNKTTNIKFLYNGKRLTLSEISKISGISYKLLYNRVKQRGFSVKDAVSTPIMTISESARNAQQKRWDVYYRNKQNLNRKQSN